MCSMASIGVVCGGGGFLDAYICGQLFNGSASCFFSNSYNLNVILIESGLIDLFNKDCLNLIRDCEIKTAIFRSICNGLS